MTFFIFAVAIAFVAGFCFGTAVGYFRVAYLISQDRL